MSVDLIRDFLSQRLVNSATTNNTSSSHSDSEEHHSDAGSSSSSSSSSIHAPAMNPQTASIFNNFASNANPFTMQNRPQSNNNNTNSFAAAIAAGQMLQMQMQLAQLAQMQLINPMMMNPLLFNPNTINGNTNNINTITNPDLNHKSSLFPTLDQLKSALQSPKHSPKNTILTPNSVPPKLTASPSPRKRCNQSKSEQKPVNLSQQHGENGGHGVTEGSPSKRPKAVKKLTFAEEETSSPVSGMFIKDASAVPPPSELQAEVDQLDETAQYVEVTEETRAAIAKIPNVIGESVCFLCKVKYEDVFRLAQHKCPRIVHEEYRCPDCDKVFSCPANLASHRRWHKPKDGQTGERHTELSNFCDMCGERFASKKQLKLHSCSNNSIKDLQTSPVVTTKLWTGQAELVSDITFPDQHSCRFCGKTFLASSTLTRHINKNHPTDQCAMVMLST